jgi:hypothetical protein
VRDSAPWARCVLLTGLLVGVADYAIGFGIFVAWLGRPLLGVFQAPAAGVLGLAAFRGGISTAALGTLLHFVIAVAWALMFALLYRRSPAVRRAVARTPGLAVASAAAGALVWLVMNNVVAPLGRGRPEPFGTPVFWAVLLGHAAFVGLPLVWGTHHFAPRETRTALQ